MDGFERAAVVPTLQRGSTGSLVRALQDKLVRGGFLSPAELATGPGVYGPRTEAAVRRLQAAVGLPQTGVAGPSTQAALADGGRFVRAPAGQVRQPAPAAAPAPPPSQTQPIPIEAHTEEVTVALDVGGRD